MLCIIPLSSTTPLWYRPSASFLTRRGNRASSFWSGQPHIRLSTSAHIFLSHQQAPLPKPEIAFTGPLLQVRSKEVHKKHAAPLGLVSSHKRRCKKMAGSALGLSVRFLTSGVVIPGTGLSGVWHSTGSSSESTTPLWRSYRTLDRHDDGSRPCPAGHHVLQRTGKGDYPAEERARLSLTELERWLTLQIAGIYHLSEHSALGTIQ